MKDTFRYQAKDTQGNPVKGEIEAYGEDAALAELERQGLFVISLTEVRRTMNPAPGTAAPQPQSRPVPLSRPAPLSPEERKKRTRLRWQISIIAVFSILFLIIMRLECRQGPRDGQVDFKLLAAGNLNSISPTARTFNMEVPKGASEGSIRLAAQQLFDQRKQKDPGMEIALINVFFPDQDPDIHNPVALARNNWDGRGQWEYTFNFQKAATLGRGLTVKKKIFKRDQFVSFDFMIPPAFSSAGAQKVGEKELQRIKGDWTGQVQRIEADLVYDNFFSPFMRCTLSMSDGRTTCSPIQQP